VATTRCIQLIYEHYLKDNNDESLTEPVVLLGFRSLPHECLVQHIPAYVGATDGWVGGYSEGVDTCAPGHAGCEYQGIFTVYTHLLHTIYSTCTMQIMVIQLIVKVHIISFTGYAPYFYGSILLRSF
jgi:hypothetical protein